MANNWIENIGLPTVGMKDKMEGDLYGRCKQVTVPIDVWTKLNENPDYAKTFAKQLPADSVLRSVRWNGVGEDTFSMMFPADDPEKTGFAFLICSKEFPVLIAGEVFIPRLDIKGEREGR